MTRRRDDERLRAEDAAWLDRVREEFSPPPLDRVRAAAFDAALRERLAARTRRPWLWAALATATAAALAWAALPGGSPPDAPRGVPDRPTLAATDPAPPPAPTGLAWEQEILFGEELDDPLAIEDGELLPDDYLALAVAFDF